MDEKTFLHEMSRAQAIRTVGDRPEYWAGYMRGLRRRYHGENFGTDDEHQLWSTATGDESRDQRSMGYNDGFYGVKNTSYTLRHIPLPLMARIKAEATIKGETIEQTILRVVARGLDDG